MTAPIPATVLIASLIWAPANSEEMDEFVKDVESLLTEKKEKDENEES